MAALASVGAYHLGSGQRISPALLLHLFQIPLECSCLLESVIQLHFLLGFFDVYLVAKHTHVDILSVLLAEQGLSAQLVSFDIYYCRRIYSSSIQHNGKVAENLAFAATCNCNGLSCTHIVAHIYKILSVVAIHCFKTVAVAHHNHIAVIRMFARKSYSAFKHRLHSISLGSGYLYRVVLAHRSLAYWQRERIFRCLQRTQVNVEGIGTREESWSFDTDLLLFGGSELLLYGSRRGGGYHQREG